MKYLVFSAGVLLLGAAFVWVGCKKVTLDQELDTLPAEERASLEAVAAAAQVTLDTLKPVAPGVLKYHPKAVAVQNGHVVELRLADTGLKQLDSLAKLPSLRALWLDGAQPASLRPLGQLKSLRGLVLSRCGLTSVAELQDLPALTKLDLSNNQLSDISPLLALPALEEVTLTGNPLKELPAGMPERWKVTSDMPKQNPQAPAAPLPIPDHWVEKPPAQDGKSQGSRESGVISNGNSWKVTGEAQSLRGAVRYSRIPGEDGMRGVSAALEVEVSSGRVRGYIQKALLVPGSAWRQRPGYAFCEASPGKPGRVEGTMPGDGAGTNGMEQSYHVILESLDGEATGIKYRLLPIASK